MNPTTIPGEHRPLIVSVYVDACVCVNNYIVSLEVLMVVAGEH